jgi:glycosyltransferase involved in cell wall biosynthesis
MSEIPVAISVITPVIDRVDFMAACIENVVAQGFAEMEHIIVDGGSTDGTVEILRAASEKYAHIRWLSEPDSGQSEAMNKGIDLARGKVLGFLNVDDYYEPGTLARAAEVLSGMVEPGFVAANCWVWSANGERLYFNKPKQLQFEKLILGGKIYQFPVNPSAYFYHRSLHQIVGPYNEEEHQNLDYEFILRAVQAAQLKYVDEHWGNFRLLEDAKTGQNIKLENMARIDAAMFAKFHAELPPVKRKRILFFYKLHNFLARSQLLVALLYFSRNADQFFPRLKARLFARRNG